jgi:phenylpyruvate tautomerase PptA (4-oxalocrotonate tautomerase family)
MIECTLIKGYAEKTRKLLAERVTDAASSTIGAHPDQVIVTIKKYLPLITCAAE